MREALPELSAENIVAHMGGREVNATTAGNPAQM